MLTIRRINKDRRGVYGLDWITALGLVRRAAFDHSLLRQSRIVLARKAEVNSPDFPDERLIVCRIPLLAAERAPKRSNWRQLEIPGDDN